MKYSKVAAAVAGSVMALGTAAPALAADGAGQLPPMSLNGALNDTLASPDLNAQHLHATQGLSKNGDMVKPLTDVADGLSGAKEKAPQQLAGTASKVLPLVGGLKTGTLQTGATM